MSEPESARRWRRERSTSPLLSGGIQALLEMGADPNLMDLAPVLLPPDAPAMKARRALARLIAA
jgi:hypothetical protein